MSVQNRQPIHTTETKKRQQRFNEYKHALRRVEAFLEIFLLGFLFYGTWALWYRNEMNPYAGMGKYILAGIYCLFAFFLLKWNNGFKFGHFKKGDLWMSQTISMGLVNFISYFQLCLMANHMLPVWPMLLLYAADIIVSILCVAVFNAIYHHNNIPQEMLLIYENENGLTLKFKMDARQDKYRIVSIQNLQEIGTGIYEEILKYDSVLINDVPAERRNDLLKFCYERGIRTYIVPKITDIIDRCAEDVSLFDTPLFLVRGRGLSPLQRFGKRAGDILLSSIAMCFFIPIFLLVAPAIKAEDGGDVFYRQKRVTRNGKEFNILKFRSMKMDAEKGQYTLAMRATGKDPRITKVGSFIRKTRLDELPQILNILKGDMSVVGPRPERVENVEAYCEEMPEFLFRNKVKAGLTGYAQVYGKYNTSAYDKLRLDLIYIENYSFLMDIKLILMTVQVMFKPEATEGFEKTKELEEKKNSLIGGSMYEQQNSRN